MAMSVLCSLTHGCPENCTLFASYPDAMSLTLEIIDDTPSDARASACELLVSLFETHESRPAVQRMGGLRGLEAIASSSEYGDALAARAKLLVRGLHQ
ncbi:MAG: hypothetical protein SGPRY_008383 [Prymnesium sp.]